MTARFVLPVLVGLLVAWAELPSATGQTDICRLPKIVGDCLALIHRWFYNWKEKRCETFYYGGCHGNENNFNTLKECLRRCGGHVQPGEPLGECPTVLGPGICVERCDNGCGPGEKCCSNGCGHVCMKVTGGTG